MGKICYINGLPYLVSLPRGGEQEKNWRKAGWGETIGIPRKDRLNQWDALVSFLGEDCDALFHWKGMYSWCQEGTERSAHVVRGYYSPRCWEFSGANSVDTGFRPVFTPLDSVSLKPDPSLLEDIPDGTRIAFTTLFMGGRIVPEPQEPTDTGDILDWIPGTKIVFGNRDQYPENWLHVIKFRDLLWLDRNILKNIYWEELETQGYAGEGK